MLPQAVTIEWRTELGATLVFGLNSTTDRSVYFHYLCVYQFATGPPTEPSSFPVWIRYADALLVGHAIRLPKSSSCSALSRIGTIFEAFAFLKAQRAQSRAAERMQVSVDPCGLGVPGLREFLKSEWRMVF